jgi:hypothetical protein
LQRGLRADEIFKPYDRSTETAPSGRALYAHDLTPGGDTRPNQLCIPGDVENYEVLPRTPASISVAVAASLLVDAATRSKIKIAAIRQSAFISHTHNERRVARLRRRVANAVT